jgi:hypothetical protein
VNPKEIADLLESSGQAFASTLGALPPETAAWHPKAGEWCVKEVVGHIIITEQNGFAGRIKVILEGSERPLPTYDRDAIAEQRNDCERPPDELRDEFTSIRRESVTLIRSLKEDQLPRGGLHPDVGRLTVGDLLHEWVHHDGNHLRQALANVQAYVWPKMGNAQRFSSG